MDLFIVASGVKRGKAGRGGESGREIGFRQWVGGRG